MDKIELIDRGAAIADLKAQFAAVYKDTMLRPIMDDDPFVEVLAKSEGRHMQLFLDGLEEYLQTRPTIDAAPMRRGEWKNESTFIDDVRGPRFVEIARCNLCGGAGANTNFCPSCGADMRGEAG